MTVEKAIEDIIYYYDNGIPLEQAIMAVKPYVTKYSREKARLKLNVDYYSEYWYKYNPNFNN